MAQSSSGRPAGRIGRRGLLRGAGLAGLSVAASALLAACGGGAAAPSPTPASSGTKAQPTTAPQPTTAAKPTVAPTAPAAKPTTAPAATAKPATTGPVTITWSFWGDPNELPPNDEVIKAFTAKHPEIQIKKFHEPWSSYFDKIQTMFAGGTAPDVLFLTNVPSYASRGVLQELDDLIKQSKYDVDDFVSSELLLFKYDNRLYGFPRDNDTKVLYYNQDAFDEAKLAYPDDKWTWKSLRDAANTLTKRSGTRVSRYGAAIEAGEWPVFVWQNGAEVYDDPFKPTKCLLDQSAPAEAISFLSDLMNKDKVIPNATGLTQAGGVTNIFGGGLAAMTYTNAPRLAAFAKAPFKWNVAVLPQEKRPANYVGGAGYVMSAQTKQKDASWTFCAFVNSADAQKIFAKGGGVVPARISVQKSDIFLKSGPPGIKMEAFITATGQGHLNGAAVIGPFQQELSQTVNKDLDLIWAGQTKPADQLKVVVKDANAKIKDLVK